jgi:hypothetical protein
MKISHIMCIPKDQQETARALEPAPQLLALCGVLDEFGPETKSPVCAECFTAYSKVYDAMVEMNDNLLSVINGLGSALDAGHAKHEELDAVVCEALHASEIENEKRLSAVLVSE